MDSIPPATTTSCSPSLTSCAARAMASRPDRQTLFTVSARTDIGMPAATAACRAVICPAPACSTCPMITYSTCSGRTRLVRRRRPARHRDACRHGRLPGGDLPRARLQYLPHDHVLDLFWADAGSLQRPGDGDAAQVTGRLAGEGPEQAADRSPRAPDNDRLTWFAHIRNDTYSGPEGNIVLPLLTRIDHVGIACRDLAKTIELYRDTFGLRVITVESNEEQGVREAMLAVGPGERKRGVAEPGLPGPGGGYV